MLLDDRLYALLASQAAHVNIEQVCVGLRYTAVTLSDGGIGLAYTWPNAKECTALPSAHTNCEGQSATVLLEKIRAAAMPERSQALALINALNHRYALTLPEDPGNRCLYDFMNLDADPRVAMVGYFSPLVARLQDRKVALEIIDTGRGVGDQARFYAKLNTWADVLVITSTSIINGTTEEIIGQAHSRVRTVMLGPSTPMVGQAFRHLPVQMLAGTVPIDKVKVLQTVQQGMGTRIIHRFSRKAYWMREPQE
jgi:uncharacterized protein (DUF4213/DUF364 family)